MKILLVGEYSRLHNSLKEGLTVLGHEVTIVGSGDGFKNFPVDILIKRRFTKGFGKLLKNVLYRFAKVDLTSENIKNQFFFKKEKFKGFDIVQLINESPFAATPRVEKKIIDYLYANNKKLFLLSCGTDYVSVKYGYQKKFRYSIFTPYFEGKVSKKDFFPALKYLQKDYEDLHTFVYSKIKGVIASDLDYHIPLQSHRKYLGMVPNPVNIESIPQIAMHEFSEIIIFHGINRQNYFKKGSDLFEEALNIILKKYPTKVKIVVVESLPYSEYIEKYNEAHILLDQVYAYDQGYNALEAMAKGKVVFTGAEKEFIEHYKLKKQVAVNALPEVEKIVEALENLIQNQKKIQEIGKNAREFIEKEHSHISSAIKYLEKWNAT